MQDDGFDVLVIGAGAIGLAVAAKLAHSRRSVLILESDMGIARGITSRNSEVIHAGIYYPAQSLKAKTCVEGRRKLYAWCEAHRVAYRRLGKWIVASDIAEERVLEDLLKRGLANGVEGLAPVGPARLAKEEPHVRAVAAIESPETGILDAHGYSLSLLASAESQGAVLALGRKVEALDRMKEGWRVEVSAEGVLETIRAEVVVDAAGLAADRIATLAGLDVDELGWRQYHCKGDYFALGPGDARPERCPGRLIYPVPQQAGLGIHATLDLAGRVRFGPDAEYLEGAVDSDAAFRVDPAKAGVFLSAVARYLPGIEGARLVPDYAGIRPKLSAPGEGFRDFVIEECSAYGAPGFVACVGIESPGLTASLAIAEHVADRLIR
jgi:L-2-hydroxyglutarate oxidase LhgO